MPDTRREKAALQTLHGDNSAGDISAQDNRDGWETCHPAAAVQAGAYASAPTSGRVTGDLYLPTDGHHLLRYDGTNWVAFGPLSPMTPPVLANFTAINSASGTQAGSVVVIGSTAASSAYQTRALVETAPATPYVVDCAFRLTGAINGFWAGGPCWRQSSDGKLVCVAVWHSSTGAISFHVENMTNPTTLSGRVFSGANASNLASAILYFRLADDGTNRVISTSPDGATWRAVYSVSRTTHLTADQIGFFLNPYSCAGDIAVYSWRKA